MIILLRYVLTSLRDWGYSRGNERKADVGNKCKTDWKRLSCRTCRRSRLCRSSSAWGSWVSRGFRRSSWARWSAAAAPRTPCPCTGRRAARGCSRPGRGRRTSAEPCCIWAGCTGPTWPWVWCKPRRIPCGASGTSRPRCTPWLRPGSDSRLSCQHPSLWMEVRSKTGLDTRGEIIAGEQRDCVFMWIGASVTRGTHSVCYSTSSDTISSCQKFEKLVVWN